ncbi:hypothetical protein QTP88_029157 [Uroleucon formosanum]
MEYNKPDALVLTGNLAENWRVFREAFEIYIEAAGLTTASNKRQVAIFLNLVGKEGLERYNTLTFENADDNKKIDQVLKAFQDYCKPKKNILHSRYIFYKRSQKENESIEEFLSACRGLIKDCEFNSHEEILRDKIVLDTRDGETRHKLIKQANVTLETAIETLRIAEIQRRELNQMKEIGEKQNEVNAVHSKVRGDKRTYQAQHHHTQNNGNNGHRGQCQTNQRQAKGCSQQEKSQQVFKNNVVNKQPINLQAYGGSNINTYFTVDLKVKLREKEYILNFVIVENHCKAILGLHSCIHLGLINKVENVDKILSLNDVLENYYTVFTGLGNFPDEYSIQLKPNAIPVTNVPHRVPINIQDKLKCELDRLVSEKVIREINEPTEWVNRLVIVEKKNGSMRLCLDPRDLNENIIREYCVIPTLSDLSSKLKNARVFSVFDLKDGFWQIKLDLDSSKLCTFGSMFGTFCFNRLPFGINNAAEICQKWNMKVFGGIENVFLYLDDILIFGDTEAQHDYALKQVLDLAMKNNIKFNKNKIQYKVDKVNYLGHIFSYEGMKLDSDRIKSIFEYEVPKTIKDLQRFLGMVNYVGNFIPNLAMLTKPLRDLLKKNNEFVWTSIHNECINKLKTLIASPSVLRNYDNTKDVIVQTDSSKFAIGCVLLQEGRPVCFKSKSLSETEINYGQVDKEFLSVLFACKVFHHYIYGRRVTVQTDHLPLISIMKKNINDIPSKRLQCIKVKLSRYDINLIHVPGKKMFIADALSRACMSSRDNNVDIDVSDVVHSINMSKNIRNEFVQETIKDDLLKQLVYMCKNGWPKHNNKVARELIPYFNMRYQISFDDDLLFLNNRVFVPMKLQNKILFKLHEAHLGICKTKTRARSLFYWKGLDKDIEEYIGNCAVCNKFRSENTKDPMICQEVPNLPFEKVACDILDYGKDTYLVLVDYYSGWLELNYLSSKTSSHIIKILKVIFSIHGIPKQLVADNMPFNSNEFHNFATDWEFAIATSSPRYPKSNGLAEKGVSIAKSILKRSDEGKVDKQLMLL